MDKKLFEILENFRPCFSRIAAFPDPPPDTPKKRGRKRKYGEKVTLIDLFKEKANEFLEATC